MRGFVILGFGLGVAATTACAPKSATGEGASGGAANATGGAAGTSSAGGSAIGPATLQLVTVVSSDWPSVPATLRRFQRNAQGGWDAAGDAIAVVIGKSGLGWGDGVVPAPVDGGPVKHEGDGRSPAGVFVLGSAFGYAAPDQATWISLPYLQATDDLECVDDPASTHYNQLVYRSTIANVDWSSSEQMKRPDELYRWGVFVAHNVNPTVPGDGSCIFLHIWSGPSSSTVGCTAADETQLKQVIAWLDPAKHPLLVQLPQAEYDAERAAFALP